MSPTLDWYAIGRIREKAEALRAALARREESDERYVQAIHSCDRDRYDAAVGELRGADLRAANRAQSLLDTLDVWLLDRVSKCPVCGERPSDAAFSGCCSVQCERAHYAEQEEVKRLRLAAPEVSRCAD